MCEIKDYVVINFEVNFIQIDKDPVRIKISPNDMKNPPENKEKIRSIIWDPSLNYNSTAPGTINLFNSNSSLVAFDESKYTDWVQPYVDIWQSEKDRLEQEEQNAREEYLKYENRKERALDTIHADYDEVLSRGFVRTSLGFDVDIKPDSTATLLGTQTGLVYASRTLAEDTEAPRTVFRDFYGLKRELDAVQVERLICEINGAQNYIRELKYKFKDQIKGTYDNDSLNAVIKDLAYSTLDYSNLDEQGNPAVLPFVESPKSILERID